MRRAAPPQMLRIDPTDPGPWAQVAAGPRGLGLVAAPAPTGRLAEDAHRVLRPSRGVPFATHHAVVVNEGALALTVAPGVARTLRLPDMANLFDRRPPGTDRIAGAVGANAGLLHDDSGWRAVVLPSMGDLVADLGSGPVALRADGRRVAVAHDGRVFELELPGAATTELAVDTVPSALAYDSSGDVVIAVGAALANRSQVGAPIVALACGASAARTLALRDDGTVSVWDGDEDRASGWQAPAGAATVALSADGRLASFGLAGGESVAACIVRADDGAMVRHITGARVIAFDPADRGILVGGDWGAMWMEPPREAT